MVLHTAVEVIFVLLMIGFFVQGLLMLRVQGQILAELKRKNLRGGRYDD